MKRNMAIVLSSCMVASSFAGVVANADTVAAKADDKKVEEKKADDKKVEEKKADDKKVEEKKADDKKVEEKKADDKKVEEKKADDKKAEEKKADDKKADDKKVEDKKASRVVEQIAGSNRYETSIKLSQKEFKASEYVVLASGETYPDALVGGVMASVLKAPLLLVPKTGLTPSLEKEITRLSAKKVYILGGKNSVSDKVEKELKGVTVKRLAGSDRYDTSLKIAKEVKSLTKKDSVAVSTGLGFADALVAAPGLAKEGTPMVLVRGEITPKVISTVDKTIKSKIKYIIGGENSVKGSVKDAKRIAGKNRFATAVDLANTFYKDANKYTVVSGENFPDALSASTFAYLNESPMLLVKRNEVPVEAKSIVENTKNIFTIIGGVNSVNPAIITGVEAKPAQSSQDANKSVDDLNAQFAKKYMDILDKAQSEIANRIKNDAGIVPVKALSGSYTEKDKDDAINAANKKIDELKAELKKLPNTSKEEALKAQEKFEKEFSSMHHGILGEYFISDLNVKGDKTVKAFVVSEDQQKKAKEAKEKKDDSFKLTLAGADLSSAKGKYVRIDKSGDTYSFEIQTKYKDLKLGKNFGLNAVLLSAFNAKQDPQTAKDKNVDVVATPTPRYDRIPLLSEKKEKALYDFSMKDDNIKLEKTADGYKVIVKKAVLDNLLKEKSTAKDDEVLILKPIIFEKLSDGSSIEHGDMVFLNVANVAK